MKKAGLALKYTLTALLTLGVIISIGLLSFSGLLLINPHLIPAILAFFLSGCIEGEVYRQNIFKGLKNFKLLTQAGINKFIIKQLNNKVEAEKGQFTDNAPGSFLKEYYEVKQEAAKYKNNKLEFTEEENHTLSAAEKKQRLRDWLYEKNEAEKRLQTMQAFYINCVLHPDKNNTSDIEYYKSLNSLIHKVRKDLPGKYRKMWLLRASLPINILASIASGFVTASATKTALLVLSLKFAFVLSGTLLSALIWPLAIVAAGGYFWLIYNTIDEIIHSDTLSKWRKKLSWFRPCKDANKQWNESKLKYVLRISAAALLLGVAIGLGVFATLATAGTWWYAAKKGVLLVPYLAKTASYLRDALVPAVGITQLVFNIKNSIDTAKNLITKTARPRPIHYIKSKWKKLKAEENWLQIINPFRIISKIIFAPCNFLIFVGHLAATGLTSDSLAKLNPEITAAAGAISEGFQDGHYFTNEEKEKNEKESSNKKKHHSHGNLLEWTLKALLSPLFFLSAVWNCLASQLNNGEKKILSFSDALKQSFGINGASHGPALSQASHTEDKKVKTSQQSKKPVSKEWLKKEIEIYFAREEERLNNVIFGPKLASRKKEALGGLRAQILESLALCESTTNDLTSIDQLPAGHAFHKPAEIPSVFKEPRFSFFSPKKTKTEEFVEEIQARCRNNYSAAA